MASPSLEELLQEEGFKGGKLKKSARSSFGSKAVSMPLYLYKDHNNNNQLGSAPPPAPGVKIRTERTRSDVSRYKLKNELPKSEKVTSRKPRDNLIRSERTAIGLKEKNLRENELFEEMGSYERVNNGRRPSDAKESERIKDKLTNELQGRGERVKDKYSNGVWRESERALDIFSSGSQERGKHEERSNKHLVRRTSFSDYYSNNSQQSENSNNKSNRTSQSGKILEDLRSRKNLDIEQLVSEPALDEAAIQAMISILNGHIRHFLKDNNFRELLRDNCISCLNSIKLDEEHHADRKVIANLEKAMETVERVTEEYENAKELKKATFQLSVITSLNSKDLDDGYKSRIPNLQLSACAHLYLSVIYKLQKKDRVSAKHLIQVFCDSPFHARKTLLPGLWEYLFLPHLSHLKEWYDQEKKSILDTSSGLRKKKLLQKLYDEILDSGTYQFAVYYKDWLTEGVEVPSLPSVHIPSVYDHAAPWESSHANSPQPASPMGSVSSQPMISKKLYDSVFGRSNKLIGVNKVKDREEEEEEENFDNCPRISDVTGKEDERKIVYAPEQGRYNGQLIHDDSAESKAVDMPSYADGQLSPTNETWGLHRVSAPREEELKDEVKNIRMWRTTPRSTAMLHGLPHKKANELILKKLAESVFQQQQTEDSVKHTAAIPISLTKDIPVNGSYTNVRHVSSFVEGQYVNDEYFEEESFSNIPKDFMCPLTGELFEDPVTLETGQTFDRSAIKEWFDQGNRTCPITGRTLECQSLPITNSVLQRVIDSWKSEHCRNLLAFATQMVGSSSRYGRKAKDERAVLILEQLLVGFKSEERLSNAKHLISLGGLQFLIQRFELGNLEEKARIATLLSCCIEADGGCRYYLAKNINKACFLELLYNKQVKSRTSAVLLLTDLICLNRRTEIASFLSSLQKDGIMNTMHVLLVYLQSCSPEQKPLVAVLLLHFDLLVEPRKYSIYGEEAVDTFTMALECSLTDEKVRVQCCKALLILGGQFSFSGELLTENWLLRQAGFYDKVSGTNDLDNIEECVLINETLPMEEEDKSRQDWWKNLVSSLLGNGKKSFLETITKCLGSENLILVRTCLITVAWISQALTLMSDAEFQLSAFSALIPCLKETLENGEQVELRVLASMSMLNFTKISECRLLLMTITDEILVPLRSLAGVTWTAKQLYAIISGESL